jgi:hypothetical protein
MEISEILNLFQMEFLKYEYTMVLDTEFTIREKVKK